MSHVPASRCPGCGRPSGPWSPFCCTGCTLGSEHTPLCTERAIVDSLGTCCDLCGQDAHITGGSLAEAILSSCWCHFQRRLERHEPEAEPMVGLPAPTDVVPAVQAHAQKAQALRGLRPSTAARCCRLVGCGRSAKRGSDVCCDWCDGADGGHTLNCERRFDRELEQCRSSAATAGVQTARYYVRRPTAPPRDTAFHAAAGSRARPAP